MWLSEINAQLTERITQQAYRQRVANGGGSGTVIQVDRQSYLNFASNDYLGLSQHPQLIEAWQHGAARFGVGSGGSGHITGYSVIHQQFEEALADWLGYPRALLFSSGFAANQALIYSLIKRGDILLADRLCHASLLEAAHLSAGTLKRFKHNDMDSLEHYDRLNAPPIKRQLIITEGIFSMDGDSAPLAAIDRIATGQQSWLMVDDAHGIGVWGAAGRGSCYQQHIHPQLLVVTFGKAFGLSGAAILCDDAVANYITQFARHLIYSTALPIAQVYTLLAALVQIQQGDSLRHQLRQNIAYFRHCAGQVDLPISESQSAIQPLIVGDNQTALNQVEQLKQRGIWLTAIRPPTVPVGKARLRITLSASHQRQQIEQVVEALHNVQRA